MKATKATLLVGLTLLLGLVPAAPAAAQASPAAPPVPARAYQYLQMTTIESVAVGGWGRSRVVFTPEFKGTREAVMENMSNMTGLNLTNIKENESTIVRYLEQVTAEGWDLVHAVPLAQTLSNGGTTGQGIFLTRYLFRKPK